MSSIINLLKLSLMGALELLSLDGTYAINDVITDYDDLSDTIILGKKKENIGMYIIE